MRMRRTVLSSVTSDSYLIRCVRKIAKSDSELRYVCPSVHPSVRLSVRSSVHPSVCPSVHPSVCPSVCLSIRPSARKTQLSLDGVHENWYLSIFRKSVKKIQVSLKPDKNIGTVHKDRYKLFYHIALKQDVSDRSCSENQNTRFRFNNFLSKIVPFMRECRKIWQSRRGHRWQCGACALHAG
jgi:hypothetical protein